MGSLEIVVNIMAISLGAVSIIIAMEAKAASSLNRKLALEYYDKSKELLHEIDKRSKIMEDKVSDNFQQLLDTQKDLISKMIIPKQHTFEEELTTEFVKKLLQTPNGTAILTDIIKQNIPKK